MSNDTAQITSLIVETEIRASPAAVWKALTDNINQWWPNDFYTGGEEGARRFFLEAHPGGRMYEEWDNGGGLLWATVAYIAPNVRLQVQGAVFPNWGGPSEWYGSWDLSATNNGTLLRFSEHSIGKATDSGMRSKEEGWQQLGEALKVCVEASS